MVYNGMKWPFAGSCDTVPIWMHGLYMLPFVFSTATSFACVASWIKLIYGRPVSRKLELGIGLVQSVGTLILLAVLWEPVARYAWVYNSQVNTDTTKDYEYADWATGQTRQF